jgi:hypothetical protein
MALKQGSFRKGKNKVINVRAVFGYTFFSIIFVNARSI